MARERLSEKMEAAATGPVLPYYQQGTERFRKVKIIDRNGKARIQTREVANSYDEAVDQGKDYWHPGGTIYSLLGRRGQVPIGAHKPGWLRSGYKWEDEPEKVWSNRIPLDEELEAYDVAATVPDALDDSDEESE